MQYIFQFILVFFCDKCTFMLGVACIPSFQIPCPTCLPVMELECHFNWNFKECFYYVKSIPILTLSFL